MLARAAGLGRCHIGQLRPRLARRASSAAGDKELYEKRLSYLAVGLAGVCVAQGLLDLLFGPKSEEKELYRHPSLSKKAVKAAHSVPASDVATPSSEANENFPDDDTVPPPSFGPTVSTLDGRLTAFSDGQHLWLRNATSNLGCLLTSGNPTVVGFTRSIELPAWLVYKAGGRVFALQPEEPAEPVEVTPGVPTTVGQARNSLHHFLNPLPHYDACSLSIQSQVFVGDDAVLMHLDGPAFPCGLYSQTLPVSDGFPTLQVSPPSNAGTVVQWIAEGGRPLCVRAVVMVEEDTCSLHLRQEEAARMGDPKWTKTCMRLGLPLPPIDPDAPPTFSEWERVASWPSTKPREVRRKLLSSPELQLPSY